MDMTFWTAFGAILILVLLSAFFAGAETALTGASRARMHQLEQEGVRRARMVNLIREHKERMISVLLLGNNSVNILASALATSVLVRKFGDSGVAMATIGMTTLILIFGEVLPKTYALHEADRLALRVAVPVRTLIMVLTPINVGVEFVVRMLLRLFGVDVSRLSVHPEGNEEELRGAIDLHRVVEKEEETREERAMLRSILDLNEVNVAAVMTHRREVEMIDASLPVGEVIDDVLRSHYTRMPLWRDDPDNIVGVLHTKALLRKLRARAEGGGDGEEPDILSIASKPWFIPDTTSLYDQLQAFRRRREHFALVVDEYGSLKGVVTLEDILEEIVGDIADEHDVQVPGVQREPGGSYIVEGRVTIRDLNREFEWRLPDGKATTIAGLMLHEARRIPNVGQVFTFYDFRFEVLARQRHQIASLRITPPFASPSS
ncbi:putative hemolysin [Azospirillaceae bacterium]